MIPQKKKEADLEKQLDDDIKKAENNSKELLKDNKPKLAQAVAMKYSKYAIIVIMAVVVGYKMFFSTKNDNAKTRTRRTETKVVKTSKEIEQENMQKTSAGKATDEIAKQTEENKQKIKEIAGGVVGGNNDVLTNVSVPKLTLPETPKLPEINTITVVKEVEARQEQEKLSKQLEAQKKEIEALKKMQKDNEEKIAKANEENEQNLLKISKLVSSNNIKLDIAKETAEVDNSGDVIERMFLIKGNKSNSSSSTSNASSGKSSFIILDNSSVSIQEPISENKADNTTKLTNLEHTIATGKIIDGILETAINSESSGAIRAIISKDVYGEIGDKILIPKGSRVYGSYTIAESVTQKRLLLTWNKIVRPDGIVVSMNAETYDQSGSKGIEGDVDTRYGEMFRNSLLYSFVTLGTAIAIEKIAGIKGTQITSNGAVASTTISPAATAAQSVVESVQNIAEKMTDGITDELNPVISIPQGTPLKIMPSTDIVINTPYKRRTKSLNFD
ncbi:MAG: hypothetical protein IJT15_01905 [Rickettsiales bacterium]|nr:hypothetical protein [Rickettsiales bacterium]